MLTIGDIIADIQRGCAIHNLNENCFSYRLIFFVNEQGNSTKNYIDTSYSGLRKTLENIIKNNLTLTNRIVIAQITIRKNGRCVCLLSRSYSFCLENYFKWILEENKKSNGERNPIYSRYAVS